jgi:hypothetical protein
MDADVAWASGHGGRRRCSGAVIEVPGARRRCSGGRA